MTGGEEVRHGQELELEPHGLVRRYGLRGFCGMGVPRQGARTPVDDASFQVELAPGSGATLEIDQRRYANQPTYEFPWRR